jgi:hypothetical protein
MLNAQWADAGNAGRIPPLKIEHLKFNILLPAPAIQHSTFNIEPSLSAPAI